MPSIGTANGLAFYVYADDHNPPHVHVYYGEEAVLLAISSGKVIRGEMGKKQIKQAQAWLSAHRAHAQAEWDRLNP